MQDPVAVIGYPIGGDTISVTSGVVSRIEVTAYVHGSTELLAVQIDAAINSGNSGAVTQQQLTPLSLWSPCGTPVVAACWTWLLWEPSGRPRPPACMAGGPVFNSSGQCVGIAFQSIGGDAENVGYAIPLPVISHFLTDFE